jgi:hypothetical protein
MNQVGLQRNQTPSGNYALNIKTRSTRYALDRVLTLKFSGLSCLTNYWHKGHPTVDYISFTLGRNT